MTVDGNRSSTIGAHPDQSLEELGSTCPDQPRQPDDFTLPHRKRNGPIRAALHHKISHFERVRPTGRRPSSKKSFELPPDHQPAQPLARNPWRDEFTRHLPVTKNNNSVSEHLDLPEAVRD